ncbi:bifunctional nuclease family protein [Desulfolutivibrio sulfoxidireducens]|uniref:bifunctional nuclease family protein n=1 Tax=Desulfolutivibrio sulfoxidireducens TaxID=2773299 RepID=UPI00159DD5B9|nr:bifunctional nuclease family protein [Desulfolutivibrio sulfoxidireducens]QLA15820.1 bifunctional nuclease family protein [Desulfolutivibrio sulfoxidireducens]QLA20277.1 bifunctional nuclease family protein [Desulfolutivibrio sulfoxidireducens]
MLEMKVFGLALDEDSQVPVLILKDREEKTVLPIWIGAMEAMAISLVLNEVKLPRPMTHDLLLNAIHDLGGSVSAVLVTSLREGTYYAEIEVDVRGERKHIDSRPSDAIALALRAGVPIMVAPGVFEQMAAEGKTGSVVAFGAEDADKWTEILEKFTHDDTKYKM